MKEDLSLEDSVSQVFTLRQASKGTLGKRRRSTDLKTSFSQAFTHRQASKGPFGKRRGLTENRRGVIVTEMLKGMSEVHPYLKFFCFFGSWFEEQQTQLSGRSKR